MGKYINIQIHNSNAVELFKQIRLWILYDINKTFIEEFEKFINNVDFDRIIITINREKKSFHNVEKIIHYSNIKEIISDEELCKLIDLDHNEPMNTYEDIISLFGDNRI
jgi:hypothetical protein